MYHFKSHNQFNSDIFSTGGAKLLNLTTVTNPYAQELSRFIEKSLKSVGVEQWVPKQTKIPVKVVEVLDDHRMIVERTD